MESTSHVLSSRMVFFYLVTTGWIFDIGLLCENSVHQSINGNSWLVCIVLIVLLFYPPLCASLLFKPMNTLNGMVCVLCVFFLPIHSGHQVRWTYQPGSHRRKVTQDFSSTFFLRCVPYFFPREGFTHCFPSSTVKSNFVY